MMSSKMAGEPIAIKTEHLSLQSLKKTLRVERSGFRKMVTNCIARHSKNLKDEPLKRYVLNVTPQLYTVLNAVYVKHPFSIYEPF